MGSTSSGLCGRAEVAGPFPARARDGGCVWQVRQRPWKSWLHCASPSFARDRGSVVSGRTGGSFGTPLARAPCLGPKQSIAQKPPAGKCTAGGPSPGRRRGHRWPAGAALGHSHPGSPTVLALPPRSTPLGTVPAAHPLLLLVKENKSLLPTFGSCSLSCTPGFGPRGPALGPRGPGGCPPRTPGTRTGRSPTRGGPGDGAKKEAGCPAPGDDRPHSTVALRVPCFLVPGDQRAGLGRSLLVPGDQARVSGHDRPPGCGRRPPGTALPPQQPARPRPSSPRSRSIPEPGAGRGLPPGRGSGGRGCRGRPAGSGAPATRPRPRGRPPPSGGRRRGPAAGCLPARCQRLPATSCSSARTGTPPIADPSPLPPLSSLASSSPL
jgi:hypothetical protein